MATGVASWSTTAASNATADANVNWAEGMAPSAVNNSARAEMASVAMWRDDINGTLTTGGSTTAYTITTNQGFASLSALSGRMLVIRFNATNGASPTLNVDGLGAKAIKIDITSAVATAAIRANSIHHVTYDNSNTCFILHGGHSLTPPGIVRPYAGTTAPDGELLCDGTSYLRATYPDLFAIIGTTYGSADATHFNVPDLRGRIPVGKDNMGGGSAAGRITNAIAGFVATTLGASGGDQRSQQHNHTITDPGHTHAVNVRSLSASATDPTNHYLALAGAAVYTGSTTNATAAADFNANATTGISLADSGAGASQNVQPSLVLNYIIKI